jgi:hypothetical protein
MSDVSVRFKVAGDAEIVLNLATPQAVRLMEAIMRKVSEALAAQESNNQVRGGWQDGPRPQPAGQQYRPTQ